MLRSRATRTSAIALVLAAALGLAACSDDGGASSEPTTTTAAPVPSEVAAEPSTGCDAATPVGVGEERVTTTSGGTERWYLRHVPPAHDGTTPVPLVLDIHGYSEGASIHARMSQLGAYGDEQGFVTVTPHGLGAIPRWDTALDGADVAFLGELLDEVGSDLCIDERRVYVTGLSNGAFMTSAVACRYADRIAAAAPVAGIREIEGCDPARPVPVVAFHGTADGFVAYDGGLGEDALDLPAPDGSGQTLRELGVEDSPEARGPSVPEITDAWAVRNGCEAEPKEHQVAADVTLITYPCPAAPVQLYRVEGGGHSWPGSEFSRGIENVVGPTTFSISANDVMWRFFRDNPRTSSS
jgi:polyhydroxybutyrate depolymerase